MTTADIKALHENGFQAADAKAIADMVSSDATAGGIFPNAELGDFNAPDIDRFKSKYCSWWPIAKLLLGFAKVFTGPRGDRTLDALIELGNKVCV